MYVLLQLLKLYAKEADHVILLVSGSGVTNDKVMKYLKDLQALSTSYTKVIILLLVTSLMRLLTIQFLCEVGQTLSHTARLSSLLCWNDKHI